jgi:aminopeptidase N
MISGYVDIKIKIIDKVSFIELDLLNQYFISKITIGGVTTPFKHRDNKIFIKAQDIDVNSTILVTVEYKGKPPIAENPPWSGGFTWSKSKDGYPWVGVSCQANGSLLWYPSKEHPSDEPESADIHITVPKPLSVASNGNLQSIIDHKNKWTTWHWSTKYSINPYNINFTIGHFDLIERIVPSLGKPLKVQFYVLKESLKGSQKLIDQVEVFIEFFTRNFGQFPWIEEKLGIVNTPYFGMEHQTVIAYGNEYKNNEKGYDFLLFHEMAHEWWGNYLSVSDWSDFWIHEGFAVYSEALYIEEKHGFEEYNSFFTKNILKKIPQSKPIVLERNSTMNQVVGLDPYYKGAFILHMLRYLVGDEDFFKILEDLLHSKKQLPNNQVTTSDFIDIVHSVIETNIDWFFKVYLYENQYPVISQKISHGSNHTFIELFWENKGFSMPVEIFYKSNIGFTKKKLVLTNEPIMIAIPQYNKIRIDPDKRVLLTIDKKE